MAGAGVIDIDEYVTALDRRLRGPGHLKRDLLAEARDSLEDAAAAYEAGGVDPAEARRRAVADFGPAEQIARDYQSLLALAHGARTLRTVLVVVPLVHVLWELNRQFWMGAWPDGETPLPGWYLLVARANDWVVWVVAGAVLTALVAGRVLARRGMGTGRLARLAGGVAVAAVAAPLLGSLSIIVATASVDVSRLLQLSPPVSLATVAMYAVMARLGVLARRCLVFSAA
ncbi:permease prefix domain 1-containing protein [Saccharothrix variisporea]|uniref:permease prefix domain 1-containing protein n=1 Tax=Saccharothrix variisporea TaxID=543527 RepID=UPI000EB392AB|nr:permease prefix domain 1-containing protein [Saccharothrix variisporea]